MLLLDKKNNNLIIAHIFMCGIRYVDGFNYINYFNVHLQKYSSLRIDTFLDSRLIVSNFSIIKERLRALKELELII